MRWLPLLLLAFALPAPAQPPSPFAPFRQACAEARRGERLARVSFYGASHTAPGYERLGDALAAEILGGR